jgi:nucleotide-binding universal stress UspA family protein
LAKGGYLSLTVKQLSVFEHKVGEVEKPRRKETVEWSWDSSPILLPLAYEPREENAIVAAFTIAEYCGSKVLVYHVKSDADTEAARDKALKLLDEHAKAFKVNFEVKESGKVVDADNVAYISKSIVEEAEETGCQAIVMSAHRETFLRELLGRISDRVARKADTKVILVESAFKGARITRQPRKIMVTVIENKFYRDALILAAIFTSSLSAPSCELIAVNVLKIPEATPIDAVERSKVFREIEREFAYKVASAIASLGRLFTPRILPVRDVGRDVASFASDEGVELIIMGSGKPARLGPVLTKDEYAIVKRAGCVALIVIPPKKS